MLRKLLFIFTIFTITLSFLSPEDATARCRLAAELDLDGDTIMDVPGFDSDSDGNVDTEDYYDESNAYDYFMAGVAYVDADSDGTISAAEKAAGADARACDLTSMIQGTICVVQSLFTDAVFELMCRITWHWRPIVERMFHLYVAIFGVLIMFRIGGREPRDVIPTYIKGAAVLFLVSNGTWIHFYVYTNFMGGMQGLSEILLNTHEELGLDCYGRPAEIHNTEYGVANGGSADDVCICPKGGYPDVSSGLLIGFDPNPMTPPVPPLPNVLVPINPPATPADRANLFDMLDLLWDQLVGTDIILGLVGAGVGLLVTSFTTGFLLFVMIWTSLFAMIIAFFNIVKYFVISMMMLTFMIMFSPIFISCLMFNITRPLFNSWIGLLIGYTLQPVLILAMILVLARMHTINNYGVALRRATGVWIEEGYRYCVPGFDSWLARWMNIEVPLWFKLRSNYVEDGDRIPILMEGRSTCCDESGVDTPDCIDLPGTGMDIPPCYPIDLLQEIGVVSTTFPPDPNTFPPLPPTSTIPTTIAGVASAIMVFTIVWLTTASLTSSFISNVPLLAQQLSRFSGSTTPMVGGGLRSADTGEMGGFQVSGAAERAYNSYNKPSEWARAARKGGLTRKANETDSAWQARQQQYWQNTVGNDMQEQAISQSMRRSGGPQSAFHGGGGSVGGRILDRAAGRRFTMYGSDAGAPLSSQMYMMNQDFQGGLLSRVATDVASNIRQRNRNVVRPRHDRADDLASFYKRNT